MDSLLLQALEKERHWDFIPVMSIIPWAKWMASTGCNIHIPATITICQSRIVHTALAK